MILDIQTPRVFLPLLKPARYKGVHGGRGSGKSFFFAEHLIERCLYEKIDAVCIREVQRTLDESVKKLLEEKIQKLGVGICSMCSTTVYSPRTVAASSSWGCRTRTRKTSNRCKGTA